MRMAAGIVLLVCLICPLVEFFDHWDDTMQTGNDTEYVMVVLALCIGATYTFARFIPKCTILGFVVRSAFAPVNQNLFLWTPCEFLSLPLDKASPPPLALRI